MNGKISSQILSHPSFAALDNDGKKAVRELFSSYTDASSALNRAFNQETVAIFRKQVPLTESIAVHKTRLDQINPASFAYLTKTQQAALEQDLLFAFYIFSAQYHLDITEDRRQNLSELSQYINRCAVYINLLRQEPAKHDPAALQKQLKEYYPDTHCKYLGLQTGLAIGKEVAELTGGTTITTREWMNSFNERRLYWVWGEGMLASILSLLPDTFAQAPQAQQHLSFPDNVLGSISWSLYYARFGLDLALLLKHTLTGRWMNEQEKLIPSSERLNAQWNKRKYNMLNDFVWATVNLVTFAWLVGAGMLGYWGNALTVVLLMADATLTILRVKEEKKKYEEQLQRYADDIRILHDQLNEAQDPEQQQLLKAQIEQLENTQRQLTADWRYLKAKLSVEIAYSVGLVLAFTVACALLIPPGLLILPATALIISTAGAVICFALTLAFSVITSTIDIAHSRNNSKLKLKECNLLRDKFINEPDENVKKALYLEMKQLMATSEHYHDLAKFQKAQLVRSVFIDVLTPTLVFLSLMFMPLGVGLGVLAAGFALAVYSKILLDKHKPTPAALPEFDDDDYDTFKKNPDLARLNKSSDSPKQAGLLSFLAPDKKDTGQTSEHNISQEPKTNK